MHKIDHRSYDSLLMKARGTDSDGNDCEYSLTFALGNGISVYDKTHGCWLYAGEWVWTNL